MYCATLPTIYLIRLNRTYDIIQITHVQSRVASYNFDEEVIIADSVSRSKLHLQKLVRQFTHNSNLLWIENYTTEQPVMNMDNLNYTRQATMNFAMWKCSEGPPRHSHEVSFPKKMVKIREISVYFDHFWSLPDGQHCSVGLLWGIWIEPSFPNNPMLLVWPEIHFGVVYPEKMMKTWILSVSCDHLWSLCDGQHCSVGLLWGVIDYVESPQHPYAIGLTW